VTIRVELLYGPACPNLAAVRELLRACLDQVEVRATVEEIEGAFPSPTLLVDGIDVAGRRAGESSACRLDLPTEHDILTALAKASAPSPA
jgi:hypothetical protein